MLDLTDVRPVDRLEEGKLQTVRGQVVDVDGRDLSGGRTLSAVLLDCNGAYVRGVWFNQPWVLRAYQIGKQMLFSGKPKRSAGRWEFAHPRVQELDEDDGEAFNGLLPRYGLTEGLRMHELRRIMREAVESHSEFVEEPLPSEFRATHNLSTLADALHELHLPSSRADYESGRRRILFDDLLEFQLGLALRRRAWSREQAAPSLPTTAKIDSRIRRLFPFQFTAGQNDAIREICEDLARTRAMHRLLQAEVGAGKTVVAIYAMLVAVAAGYQTAMMAPTEALAWQHWETLENALAHSRVNRLLLTGALNSSARESALERLRTGEVNLVVGTQALIQRDVTFHKLGLVVIDEQHKFGVMQRAKFSQGAVSPHVLVMTATPIPRSLCMTQFGDLDVTTITQLPPGRQPVITTRISGSSARRRAWDFVRKQLREGRQLYVVCPRIENQSNVGPGIEQSSPNPEVFGSTEIEQVGKDATAGAEETFRQLSTGELAEFRVGLVHGRMDRETKAGTLTAFNEGNLQVLVSTTVIEVGIDVPNATLMVIYQAERFGLAQLHQLRGRIARGKFQGYCFLFSENESVEAAQRLEAAEANSNGFKIAEIDFEMRGPGDVLGIRQHGDLPLRAANLLRDAEILVESRHAAFALVDSGKFDEDRFGLLKSHVVKRFGKLMALPQSG
jgi:ATP-dependent DNA helicase RecG